jgi:hypothetical protein
VPERIWHGQFNIIGGDVQEHGPYAATIADRSVAESIADLSVALQPTRPDTDQICAEVMHTVERIFGRSQYSVTGNLLLALGKAHQHLREWNRASLAEHRIGVGISCAAIAGEEAYVAQAGPGVAFYRHNGRTRRLVPLEEATAPIGESDTLSPSFHRLELTRGDSLLLLTGELGMRADERAIERCLALEPETGLPELFRLARGQRDCGAVLLVVLDDPVAATEVEDEPAPYGEPIELPPAPGRAAEPRIRFPEEGGPPRDLPLEEPPTGTGRHRPPSPFGRNPFRRAQAGHPDEGDGVLRVLGQEQPRRPIVQPPTTLSTPEAVLAAALTVTQPSVRMRATSPGFRSAFPGLDGPRRSLRPYLLVGAGVLAFALITWVGIPALLSTGRTQRFASLMRSAKSEFSSAQSESDLSRRRELLNQALSNVDEAKRLRPGDPQADSQATSVQDALTVMDAVYTLPDVPALADLSNAGLSPSSAVEVAAGDSIYVLDVAAGKVFVAARDGSAQPDPAYEDGSDVDGVRAGKAQHIAWEPPSQSNDPGTLLILDAGRHLFGLSRGNLRAIPLRGVEQLRSSTAMAFSGGSLYLLDAQAATVWRYDPSNGGFDTEPAPAVARADIRDANGISVVGGVFLTGQDGRIRRFLDGQESAFKLAGIDRPPAAPQPPLYDPAAGLLYIADRGNSRIVVLEGDGRFKRQLVHAKLAGLRGATVDPGQNRLLGVIGSTLVAIPLP